MPEDRQDPEGSLALRTARELVRAALASLEANRERIDNLNVYPVPDGDTGTNMVLTIRAVGEALDALRASEPVAVAHEVTRACLMGARGNSGVILSQLVRGAAEVLAQHESVDAVTLARVLRAGSDTGYDSVREPQEGTILTVAREMAERAEAIAPSCADVGEALADVVGHGEAALALTREQLDVLREAGVVDAGAAGLLELVRGIAAHVRGEPVPKAASAPEALPLEAVHGAPSRYRYCTSFYVEGQEADPERLERELVAFGDSVLVVGTRGAVKVHFHTDEPGRALSLATAVGVVEEVDIRNMHVQTAERTERLLTVAEAGVCDVVAVCAGAGNARLFQSLGAARIVEGGQSMNPPASALVEAIDSVPASQAIVLPNNKNVVLTAEQAASVSDKDVYVVPTHSMQAGLGAMVAFDRTASAEQNASEMEAAANLVRAGAVTRASRSTVIGGLEVEEGLFLGLVDGDPVVCGPVLAPVAREVIERLLVESSDVVTILLGDGVTDADGLRREIEAAHPELEIDVHEGGQPHYPLLFSVE
jgi:DAK2 domain fusion protein YloV